MQTKAKFVTPDDFLNYTGIDLDSELRDSGSPADSNKADMFLCRVERRFLTFVDSSSFRNYDWDELAYHPRDLEAMKTAILEQALYVFKNGDLSIDSGYDQQRGTTIEKNDLMRREISTQAIDILKNAGLFNQNVANKRRYTSFF